MRVDAFISHCFAERFEAEDEKFHYDNELHDSIENGQ